MRILSSRVYRHRAKIMPPREAEYTAFRRACQTADRTVTINEDGKTHVVFATLHVAGHTRARFPVLPERRFNVAAVDE